MPTDAQRHQPRLTPEQRHHARAHTVLITTAFILFWIPVIIAAKIAGEVVEREPIRFDVSILVWVHSFHTPALDNFFLFLTSIGDPTVVTVVGIILIAICAYKRWWRYGAALVAGVGGAVLANLVLKLLFARSRPSVFTPLIRETSYSFPSGHAMVSSAFVCIIMLLLWHTKFRIWAIVIGFIATFLIGLSRIYLGVHYPTDILAGWCIGMVWAVLAGSVFLNRPFGIGRRLTPLLHRNR